MNPIPQKPKPQRVSEASVAIYKRLTRQSILFHKNVFNEKQFYLKKMQTSLEKETKFSERIKNLLRKKCFQFLQSNFYNYVISICEIFAIVLACLYNFPTNEQEIALNIDQTSLYVLTVILNVIFLLEFIIKAIARGLFFGEMTYFRNIKNILEFINMSYGILEIVKLDDYWLFQIFKIGRPLRVIFDFKGIEILLNCMKQAIWNVFHTIIFIMFFMLIFSILGNNLYGKVYYNRCRLDPEYDKNLNRWIGKVDPTANLCKIQYRETEFSYEILESSITNISSTNYFSTEISCIQPYTCYNILDPPKIFNLSHLNFSYLDDNLNSQSDLYYGIRNFDGLHYAFLSVFTVMTFQSWSQLVSIFDDSIHPVINRIFFVPLLIFLGFFLMKFILAAENNALMKTFKKEKQVKNEDSVEMQNLKKINSKNKLDQNQDENLNDEESKQIDQSSEFSIEKSESSSKFSFESSLESEDNSNAEKKYEINKNDLREDGNIVKVLMKKKTLTDNKSSNNKGSQLVQTHLKFLSNNQNENKQMKQSSQLSPTKGSRRNSKKSNSKGIKNLHSKMIILHPDRVVNNDIISRSSQVTEKLKNNRKVEIGIELEKIATVVKEKMNVLISTQHSNHILNFLYYTIIYFSILTNTIVVSFNSYPSPLIEPNKVARINFGFNIVMLVDTIIRFCVIGYKKFFLSKENIIIVVLVTFSIIEYFLGSGNVSGISTMQLIRLLLILQVGKVDLTLRKLISFWVKGYREVFYYFVLLFLVFSIFLITGRVLFYDIASQQHEIMDVYGYWDNEAVLLRENFNSFTNGLMTVIIVFLGDNWPQIMQNYAIKDRKNIFFFILLVVIGNIILINLFLSIVMVSFEDKSEVKILQKQKSEYINIFIEKFKNLFNCMQTFVKDNVIKKIEQLAKHEKIKSSPEKQIEILQNSSNVTNSKANHVEKSNDDNNVKRRKDNFIGHKSMFLLQEDIIIDKNKVLTYKPLVGKSLYLFDKNNKLRKFLWNLMQNKTFDFIISLISSTSVLILAIDGPNLDNSNEIREILYIIEITVNSILFLVMICNIISYGFLFNGTSSFLRDFNAIIEIISIFTSISYYFVYYTSTLLDFTQVMKILKTLRILRIIKIISKLKYIQASYIALFTSLKSLLSYIFIASCIMLIFSLMCMNYLQGQFQRCDFRRVPRMLQKQVITKWDCVDYGGQWMKMYPNFDNLRSSIVTIFEMSTASNWIKFMYAAVDSTQINYQPIYNNKPYWKIFSIIIMFACYLFLINLFLSVLSENYLKEKDKVEYNQFTHNIQKEFFKIFEKLFKINLPVNISLFNRKRKRVLLFVESYYYKRFNYFAVLSNIIILSFIWINQDDNTLNYLDLMKMIYGYYYIFDTILKFYIFRLSFFQSSWRILDLLVSIESLIFISSHNFESLYFLKSSVPFKCCKVLTIFKFCKISNFLNKYLLIFKDSLISLFSIGITYLITIFIYSVIGMNVFGYVKYDDVLNSNWNFNNFINSAVLLIRVSTGDDWNGLMHSAVNERKGNYNCLYISEMTSTQRMSNNYGCGSSAALPFFISFYILANFVFIEFFAVILSSALFDESTVLANEIEIKFVNNKYFTKWIDYDPDCTGFILLQDFRKFITSLDPAYGLSKEHSHTDFFNLIKRIDIPTYGKGKYIYFYDVLIELTTNYLLKTIILEEFNLLKHNGVSENEESYNEKFLVFNKLSTKVKKMKLTSRYTDIHPGLNNTKYEISKLPEKIKHIEMFKYSRYINYDLSLSVKKIQNFLNCYRYMRKKIISKFDVIYERNIYYQVLNVIYFTKFFHNLYEKNLFDDLKNSSIFSNSNSSSNSGSSLSYAQSKPSYKSNSYLINKSHQSINNTVTHNHLDFFRLIGNGNSKEKYEIRTIQNGNGALIESLHGENISKIKSVLKSNGTIQSQKNNLYNKEHSIRLKSSESEDIEDSVNNKNEINRKNPDFSQINESENGSVINTPKNTQTNLLSVDSRINLKSNLTPKNTHKPNNRKKLMPKITNDKNNEIKNPNSKNASYSEKNSFSH